MDHASSSGLLCGSCNRGISDFGEDPDRIEDASAYVRKYR
jgi:hypothetical protein